MKSGMSWSIKGIDDDLRDAAVEAARQSGLSVSEWLNRAIARRAAEEGVAPHRWSPDEDDDLRLVADSVAELTRHIRAMDANSRSAISGLKDRLDEIESRFGRAHETSSPSERRTDSLKDIAAMVAELGRELDNAGEGGRTTAESQRVRPASASDRPSPDRVGEAIRSLDERIAAMAERIRSPPAPGSSPGQAPRPGPGQGPRPGPGQAPRSSPGQASEAGLDDLRDRLEALLARAPEPAKPSGTNRAAALDATLRALETRFGQASGDPSAAGERPSVEALTDRSLVDSIRNEVRALRAIAEAGAREASVTDRFDALARRLPEPTRLDALGAEISALRTALESADGPRAIGRLEMRVSELARSVEAALNARQAVIDASIAAGLADIRGAIRDLDLAGQRSGTVSVVRLEDRLDHFAARIDGMLERTAPAEMIHGLNDRLEALLDRLDRVSAVAPQPPALAEIKVEIAAIRSAIAARGEPRIDHLESQIRDLASRLETVARPGPGEAGVAELAGEGTRLAGDLERAGGDVGKHPPKLQAPPPDALATLVGRLTKPGEATPPADNRPFEPGSGDPDLAALGELNPPGADRAMERSAGDRRADFIAAARRAAQAAAAETRTARATDERLTEQRQSAFARIGRAIRNRKRTLLLAAAAVVLAAGAWHVFGSPGPAPGRAVTDLAPEVAALPADPSTAPLVAEAEPPRPASRAGESALVAPPANPQAAIAFASPEPVGGHFGGAFEAPDSDSFSAAKEGEAGDTMSDPAGSEDVAGPGVAPIPAAAFGSEKLRAALAAGEPAAFFEVAARYAEGRGVGQDLAAAAEWYRQAAEGGLAVAEYRLGSLYERGQGVVKDRAVAVDWYQRAADQGNIGAMHNLGVMMSEGIDGQPGREKALQWFLAAADYGVKDSQYNLGIIHTGGPGAERDLAEAYKWFAIAAAQGDSDAAARRDEVAGMLMPDRLAIARAAVVAWHPRRAIPEANGASTPPGGWDDRAEGISEADRSDLVKKIQALLTEHGYDPGPADGVEGPKTREAVRAFQRTIGAAETGSIDGGLVTALADKPG